MSTNLQAGRHLYLRLSIGCIYLIKFVNSTFDLLDLVCLEESIQLALIILFLSNYIVRTCLFLSEYFSCVIQRRELILG